MVLNTNKGIMKAHGFFGSVPKCRFLLNVTSGLSTKIASMWKKYTSLVKFIVMFTDFIQRQEITNTKTHKYKN